MILLELSAVTTEDCITVECVSIESPFELTIVIVGVLSDSTIFVFEFVTTESDKFVLLSVIVFVFLPASKLIFKDAFSIFFLRSMSIESVFNFVLSAPVCPLVALTMVDLDISIDFDGTLLALESTKTDESGIVWEPASVTVVEVIEVIANCS